MWSLAISQSSDYTREFLFYFICTLKKRKQEERVSQLNYTSLTIGTFIRIHSLFDEKIGMQQVYNRDILLRKKN